MLEVIDWVLRNCGVPFEKALVSKRFSTLLKKEHEIGMAPPNSSRAIALKSGHLEMSRLLNCLPEKEAINQAKSGGCNASHSPEERALIRFCGEKIIRSARECLPEEVVTLARQWEKSSSEEQIAIVRRLYGIFRSESQKSAGNLTMQVVAKEIREKPYHDYMHDELGYLPSLYGRWNKNDCWASCQGKAQMIVAFAKLAGAQNIVTHPIVHVKDIESEARRRIKTMVLEDLRARGLENSCEEFSESLRASAYYDHEESDFHVSVSLRLNDSSWVLLDPHGLCWGRFSPSWNMGRTCSMLKKYRSVLPGLTIMAHDQGDGKRLINGNLSAAADIISRSRMMEKKIKSRVRTIADLINVICESSDFDLLNDLLCREEGREPVALTDHNQRRYAAMITAIGDVNKLCDFNLISDPNFLDRQINLWLTFYHSIAMNMFMNRETDEGLLIHPVCEFSASSEWSIATSALNSASCRISPRNNVVNEFFVRNGSDQTTLFNAVKLPRSEVGMAAYETLRALPFIHPLCAKRISRTAT